MTSRIAVLSVIKAFFPIVPIDKIHLPIPGKSLCGARRLRELRAEGIVIYEYKKQPFLHYDFAGTDIDRVSQEIRKGL